MGFETIQVRVEPPVCTIKIDRGDASNTINGTLVAEFGQALDTCEQSSIHVVVIEGSAGVFCLGADFKDYAENTDRNTPDPAALYDLWERLGSGPFVSIAHVQGKANAGGVGFVAACDIVLADRSAHFGLSEMVFSLFPACVLPFLIKRIGVQRAHFMTLTTAPITAQQALDWGLVDDCDANSETLLRKHLLRLRRLSKSGIRNYKAYMNTLNGIVAQSRSTAIAANRALFSDPDNREAIRRFVQTGVFPWEE